jgi:chromosomal replication initiation ATPase DnaA
MTPRARKILEEVARQFNASPEEVRGRTRKKNETCARIRIAQRLRAELGYSSGKIGQVINKNYSTVLVYLGCVTNRRMKCQELIDKSLGEW